MKLQPESKVFKIKIQVEKSGIHAEKGQKEEILWMEEILWIEENNLDPNES